MYNFLLNTFAILVAIYFLMVLLVTILEFFPDDIIERSLRKVPTKRNKERQKEVMLVKQRRQELLLEYNKLNNDYQLIENTIEVILSQDYSRVKELFSDGETLKRLELIFAVAQIDDDITYGAHNSSQLLKVLKEAFLPLLQRAITYVRDQKSEIVRCLEAIQPGGLE